MSRCDQCAAYRPLEGLTSADTGECHMRAPCPLTMTDDELPDTAWVLFPRVDADSWCLEYRPGSYRGPETGRLHEVPPT
jgi:hypothetical protein